MCMKEVKKESKGESEVSGSSILEVSTVTPPPESIETNAQVHEENNPSVVDSKSTPSIVEGDAINKNLDMTFDKNCSTNLPNSAEINVECQFWEDEELNHSPLIASDSNRTPTCNFMKSGSYQSISNPPVSGLSGDFDEVNPEALVVNEVFDGVNLEDLVVDEISADAVDSRVKSDYQNQSVNNSLKSAVNTINFENQFLVLSIRDVSSAIKGGFEINKETLVLNPVSLTVSSLIKEVAEKFRYKVSSFSLSYQKSNGKTIELSEIPKDILALSLGFSTGPDQRNNLMLMDLKNSPPIRIESDDLDLGASASPIGGLSEGWSGKIYGSNSGESNSENYTKIKTDYGPIEYVGLVNQAMTCYLNSLLQTLFMTPEFRNALYRWQFTGTDEEGLKNIPYQLQKLFLQLQTSKASAVETTNLTKSFGWDSSEAWQQHDVQELYRVMFDALEQCFKNTDQAEFINNLYQGKMKDYVKCLKCDIEKAREDSYLDIPLPIRPFGSNVAYKSVEEALKVFVEPELLNENNQYKCSMCSTLCDAHKGLKFTTFPYLLTLHLKRFDFDYQTFHRIKLNDKVVFPKILNLNSFTELNETFKISNSNSKEGLGAKNVAISSNKKCSVDKVDDSSDSGSALDGEESSSVGCSVSNNTLNDADTQDEDEGIDISGHPVVEASCARVRGNLNVETSSNSTIEASGNPTISIARNSNIEVSSNCDSGNLSETGTISCEATGPYVYELFSIMIHSGSAAGGHYYAYIKDLKTDEWFCFNDQSVSRITDEDIERTYGATAGQGYCGYYTSYTSSSNAYMLMYRKIDKDKNCSALTEEEFPQHIKDLLIKMEKEQEEEKNAREIEKTTCRIKVFCLDKSAKTSDKTIKFNKNMTLREATKLAYEELIGVETLPLDRCRLVKFEDVYEYIERSFDGMEDTSLAEILDNITSYKFELLLEVRGKKNKFITYKAGGVTIKVQVVDIFNQEVCPIRNIRADQNCTVAELKLMVGEELYLCPEKMRVVVERYNSDLKLLSSDSSLLKDEGFFRTTKIYVESSGEEPIDVFQGSLMQSILERYENKITVFTKLPERSLDLLCKLGIPSYELNENKYASNNSIQNGSEFATWRKSLCHNPSENMTNSELHQNQYSKSNQISLDVVSNASSYNLLASSVNESNEINSNISVKSKYFKPEFIVDSDSADVASTQPNSVECSMPKKGLTKASSTISNASTQLKISPTTKSQLSYHNSFTNLPTTGPNLEAIHISNSQAQPNSPSNNPNSLNLALTNISLPLHQDWNTDSISPVYGLSDDEECPDMELNANLSGAGSSTAVSSDQSASEDSSLTSDTDRTLVGEPPEDNLSDNNSPDYQNDYPNVSSPEPENESVPKVTSFWFEDNGDRQALNKNWNDFEGAYSDAPRKEFYFKASFIKNNLLRISVDKRITVGQFKEELQRFVGVPHEHFQLFRSDFTDTNTELECIRMKKSLKNFPDCTVFRAELSRALLPGEFKGKVYLLDPNNRNAEEVSKFLIDFVIKQGNSIDETKAAIINEIVAKWGNPFSFLANKMNSDNSTNQSEDNSDVLKVSECSSKTLNQAGIIPRDENHLQIGSKNLYQLEVDSKKEFHLESIYKNSSQSERSLDDFSDSQPQINSKKLAQPESEVSTNHSKEFSETSIKSKIIINNSNQLEVSAQCDKIETNQSNGAFENCDNSHVAKLEAKTSSKSPARKIRKTKIDELCAKFSEGQSSSNSPSPFNNKTKYEPKKIKFKYLKSDINSLDANFSEKIVLGNKLSKKLVTSTENTKCGCNERDVSIELGQNVNDTDMNSNTDVSSEKLTTNSKENSNSLPEKISETDVISLKQTENIIKESKLDSVSLLKEQNTDPKIDQVNTQFLDLSQIRLRKKSWRNPQTIYLDHQKVDDDILVVSNWEWFIQHMHNSETKINEDDLSIFLKRFYPSNYSTEHMIEVVLQEHTVEALIDKISCKSGLPREHIVFCKARGTFPCDMSVLDIDSDLQWQSLPTNQENTSLGVESQEDTSPGVEIRREKSPTPLGYQDDGAVVYFKDNREILKELSTSEKRNLENKENIRLNRECSPQLSTDTSSTTSRHKEKGLKIYLLNGSERQNLEKKE